MVPIGCVFSSTDIHRRKRYFLIETEDNATSSSSFLKNKHGKMKNSLVCEELIFRKISKILFVYQFLSARKSLGHY